MTAVDDGATIGLARILDGTVDEHARLLNELRADASIEQIDTSVAQRAAVDQIDPELTDEPPRFAHYPWRRALVKIVGPQSYRRLRLDRNRNLITTGEQDRLGRLRIGVIGLSSGHVIAHTLAMQGLCGELRLADFDDLELTNLNRIPAGVFDLGLNKTIVASRRIAELDPYLTVQTMPDGVSAEDIGAFMAGLDVVIEECDSLDVKVCVRRVARQNRIPVLMATSDRGLVDVERFDLEPDRPIFHGLLGDVDADALSGLSAHDKVPYVLRLIEVGGVSARAAASLLEVGHAITTWPQLAGDLTLGAGAVAEAVRRIGLCEPLSSGRIRLDVGAALERIESPAVDVPGTVAEAPDVEQSVDAIGLVVAAALRAPSGGNVQPWTIAATRDTVTVDLAPERTSTIDVGLRGSAVAVGAAAYNARVAAAANGLVGRVHYVESPGRSPLRARVELVQGAMVRGAMVQGDVVRGAMVQGHVVRGDVVRGDEEGLAEGYAAMLRRATNRHRGTGVALAKGVSEKLVAAAHDEGARLCLLDTRADIDAVADIFSAADRIRYLTPRLHEEMISELRWPGDPDPDTGIDVRSLELDPGDLLALEILRRPEVMAELAGWDGGAVLGEDTAGGLQASSAVAVVCAQGQGLADYARGGSAMEATWIRAQEMGLAVAPISPPFLYVKNEEELHVVAPTHADELAHLQSRFHAMVGIDGDADESLILVLRLSVAPPATVRSRRRVVR